MSSEQPQAQLPEARIGHVHAQLAPAARAAHRSRRDDSSSRYRGTNAGAFLLVLLHQGQHQQFAEGVGVAVERHVDEVADVQPPPGVAVGQLHHVAVHRPVGGQPEFVDLLRRQLALLAGGPGAAPARSASAPPGGRPWRSRPRSCCTACARRVARLGVELQQPLERQHLAEDAGHLRRGQRRVALQDSRPAATGTGAGRGPARGPASSRRAACRCSSSGCTDGRSARRCC